MVEKRGRKKTMYTINMLSKADRIKGQGVLSAHDEQVNLIKTELKEEVQVFENGMKFCNIMHYHTINPGFFFGLPLAKLFGKTVGYVHFLPETLEGSIHIPKPFKKVFYWYVIQFYKNMDYLVTVNSYFIERLAAYGIDKNKVTYIPNFVSEEQFYKIEDKKGLREKYGIKEEEFVVLCAGQLQKRKGIFDFIETAKKMPQIKFLWAGDFAFGKISDGFEEIKKIAANPPANVSFLGLIERENMNEIYNLADVMFLPSFEELFPMTILESMNSGTPILLRNLDIYKDILFDFYLSGSQVEDFVQIIQELRENAEFYQKAEEMSFRGHKFYSRQHVASMWKEFYKNVVMEEQKSKAIAWLLHPSAWKKI